jgi:ATP synthase protein I
VCQVKQELKAIGSFGTLGLEVVLCMLVGFLGGRWLDGRFGTAPYVSLVGLAFGIAAGVKAIVRSAREMRAITEKEEREQGNPAPILEPPGAPDDKKGEGDERA